REKRGITLEQISKSTKIGTRFLEALEEDHFERLPGGIFNKGFVRAYARCVGLDEEQTVSDYLAAAGASQPTAPAIDEPPVLELPPQPKIERAASLPWGIFATILLITAFGFAIWGFYFRATTNSREKEPAQTSQPQAAQPQTPPLSPGASATNIPPPQAAVSSQSSTSGQSSTQPLGAGKSVGTSALSTSPENAPAPVERGLVLRIKADEEAWLSITVDGEVTSELTLTQSGEKTVRAHNEIIVKTGNIGALNFELNGKALPHQGESGEVKTLAFTAQGLRSVSKTPPAAAQQPQP
ncbi:MAG: DUF4115 domain-containing protein, partial [Acidobacteriaceae bacterium]|nr:DUF4115 domain-containing protein [Acidobacteriaceae bacterium]